MKIHDFTWAVQDWIGLMILKNFADQDWTLTEKFHSPSSLTRCQAKFLTSHHVCMHRLMFFMANTLIKLIIRA